LGRRPPAARWASSAPARRCRAAEPLDEGSLAAAVVAPAAARTSAEEQLLRCGPALGALLPARSPAASFLSRAATSRHAALASFMGLPAGVPPMVLSASEEWDVDSDFGAPARPPPGRAGAPPPAASQIVWLWSEGDGSWQPLRVGPPRLRSPQPQHWGPWDLSIAGDGQQGHGHARHVVHYLSPITTVLLVFISALFAARLVREMAAAQRAAQAGAANQDGIVINNQDGVVVEVDVGDPRVGAVTVEAAGIQPFRPFGGQGHRLQPAGKASAPGPAPGSQATADGPPRPPPGPPG
ncbi:unnamed protein product, partial [Prorocentrum cordatum]